MKTRHFWIILLVGVISVCALSSCDLPLASPTDTPVPPTNMPSPVPPTYTFTPTETYTSTYTPTPEYTLTPTQTLPPTETPTSTESPTSTATASATITNTPEAAMVNVDENANCRYGPSTEYHYAWGLDVGDWALLHGRNYDSSWVWVRPHDTDWNCWVIASVVTPNVDLSTVPFVYSTIWANSAVSRPQGVQANRNGNNVTISWAAAPPAIDLEYLVEARICTNGFPWDVAYSTTGLSMTLQDAQTCSTASYGTVRVYNKLGYSEPATIPWP